jgi:signal transduction histidine kinase
MGTLYMSRTSGYRWYWPHVPDAPEVTPRSPGRYALIYALIIGVFALPWVEDVTGVRWTAIAAVILPHAVWLTFAGFVLTPHVRRSRRLFDILVIGNVVVGTICAAMIVVVGNAPGTVMWGATILYATMLGAIAEIEPSIPILGLNVAVPLATIPVFVGREAEWAVAGPIIAAGFAAAGYHLSAMLSAKGLQFQRAAVAAQRQASEMRLARDLHDVVGSTLGSVKIYADLMAPTTPIGHVAQSGLDDLRAVLDALSPPREGGLEATISSLLHRLVPSHIDTRVSGTWPTDVPANVRVAAARVTQEAIYNALRHGQPTRIEIEAALQTDKLTLHIRDDGRGFDVAAAMGTGRGLTTMRTRVEELAGTFAVTSAKSGSCVAISMPVAA